MIVLRANPEMEATFQRLIQTTGERVKWNGYFVVIGNYLILHGENRSLFFNFDNRKVVSNFIELTINEDEVIDIKEYPKVQNIINMLLYAFGKWGTVKGIKVEKSESELNLLFVTILKEISVEPDYTWQKFRFMKDGILITYEDVIQLAIEEKENPLKEMEESQQESEGLWHSLIWQKRQKSFSKIDITEEQRNDNRIGFNFYMVGYRCPKCSSNLHMVVFPEEAPFYIETNEGQVKLSRAYTCSECDIFYTPWPELLLIEGEIFEMDFEGDDHAYEDYRELLGSCGERVSNCHFNEFVDPGKQQKAVLTEMHRLMEGLDEEERRQQREVLRNVSEEALAKLIQAIPTMNDLIFNRFTGIMDDGFYSEQAKKKYKKQIEENISKRKKNKKRKEAEKNKLEKEAQLNENETVGEKTEEELAQEKPGERVEKNHGSDVEKERRFRDYNTKERSYISRISKFDDLSESQQNELKREIEEEKEIRDEVRGEIIEEYTKQKRKSTFSRLKRKAGEVFGKAYKNINHVIKEIEAEDLSQEQKEELLPSLRIERQIRGEEEVQEFMKGLAANMDREQYKKLARRLSEYADIDISVYQEKLDVQRAPVEREVIQQMVNQTNLQDREAIIDLLERLDEGEFSQKALKPFIDHINENLKAIDEKELNRICNGYENMDFSDITKMYQQISEGDFLPELKVNALEMLSKRLARIKMEECELLVDKLKAAMEGKISSNARHHFYPAREILNEVADPDETELINYALGTYAGNRKAFEYPILVVDTSLNKSGKEGMILTSEHLFCSTLLSAHYTPISKIKKIHVNNGLLGKGITVEQTDGKKIKVPFAVPNNELKAWGNILTEYIKYLKEKPQSRQVKYLEKEKHDTICCYRCGFVYKGATVCPECGCKSNR